MRSPHFHLFAALLVAGCAAPVAPRVALAPPAGLVATTRWEPGTLVAPEVITPIRGREPVRTVVRVAIALLDARPETGGERLPDAVSLVADPRTEGGVKTPSSALVEGRVWRGAEARTEFERLRAGDATQRFVLLDGQDLAADSGATWFVASAGDRSVALGVQSDGTALRVALEHHGNVGERAKLVAPFTGEGDALLAVVATPFLDGRGDWCALWLEARHPVDGAPDSERWRARASALAFERNARIAAGPPPAPPASDEPSAWSGLPIDGSGRRALAWFTERHRDTLASDFTLVCSDESLAQLLDSIAVPRLFASDDARAAALEKYVWRMFAAMDAKDELPDELRAAALRRGGVVATDAASMDALSKTAGLLPELQARLVEENRVALESSSAAARVRAFEWLAARSLAPAGFDPLAPVAQRRKALAADAARPAGEPERRDG